MIHISEAFLICISLSYDSEREVWEVREPLPQRMDCLTAIELDGLFYVMGDSDRLAPNFESNFWCYNPIADVWTPKYGNRCRYYPIGLVVIHDRICVCNGEVRLMRYHADYDAWADVPFRSPRVVDSFFSSEEEARDYRNGDGELDYELRHVIDFKNECFGLFFVASNYFIAKIVKDREEFMLHAYRVVPPVLDMQNCLTANLDIISCPAIHLFSDANYNCISRLSNQR